MEEVVSLREMTGQLELLKEIGEIAAPLDRVLAGKVFLTALRVVERVSAGSGL
jgi:hypothetical protein